LSRSQSSRFPLISRPGRGPRSIPSKGFCPPAHGASRSGMRTVNGIPLKPIFLSDLKQRSVTAFAPNARRSSRRITSTTRSAGDQCREVQFNSRRGCSSSVPVHSLSYYPGFGWLPHRAAAQENRRCGPEWACETGAREENHKK